MSKYLKRTSIILMIAILGCQIGDVKIIKANDFLEHTIIEANVLTTTPQSIDIIEAQNINFLDNNFKQALLEQSVDRDGNGEITVDEMNKITKLYLDDKGIEDITGIQYATHLQQLRLSNNKIIDITPLENLENIYRLDLSGNKITDISSLHVNDGMDLYIQENYLDVSEEGITKQKINEIIEKGGQVFYTPQKNPIVGNPEEEVIIKDPNLRSALIDNGVDFNGDGKITRAEMADLRTLDDWGSDGNKIRDLSGIEYAINLKFLQLVEHEIADITPITFLRNLEYLCIEGHPIKDISPVYNLSNLKTLALYDCGISEVDEIAKMSQLEALQLTHNPISNITPLYELKNLETLNIGYCDIQDISGIEALEQLKELWIANNKIVDITPVYKLKNLIRLDISDCGLVNIQGIEELKNLRRLDLGNNIGIDIAPIRELSNLRSLVLKNCELTDISPLESLHALQMLALDNNKVDISVVFKLEELSSLSMEGCGIREIEGINNLKELQHLNLSRNNIRNIDEIHNLPYLLEVDLSNNQIEDIKNLKDLPHVYVLNLSSNKITDIQSVLDLPRLENLHLEWNSLDLSENSSTMYIIQELLERGVNVSYQPQQEEIKSANTNLSSITVNKGNLNPTFNEAIQNYTVEVDNYVDHIIVEATTADTYAKVTGTGEKSLVVGSNLIRLVVTAEDGTTKDYIIRVNRKGAVRPSLNDGDEEREDSIKPITIEQVINQLKDSDKQIILKNFKEYTPYTTIDTVLTIEQLRKLTNNQFTDKQLQEIIEKPELLKVIEIDLSTLNTKILLKPIKDVRFKDVSETHWANESIKIAAEMGFVEGMSDGTFAPSSPLQVADTFTFLDRVLLLNHINEMKLSRSVVEKYITDKAHWAFANVASIGSKLSESTLATIAELKDNVISRELLAQVLYEITSGKLEVVRETIEFEDIQQSYYQEAIEYCVGTGLLNGVSDKKMAPQKVLTRAELMMVLIRLNEALKMN